MGEGAGRVTRGDCHSPLEDSRFYSRSVTFSSAEGPVWGAGGNCPAGNRVSTDVLCIHCRQFADSSLLGAAPTGAYELLVAAVTTHRRGGL